MSAAPRPFCRIGGNGLEELTLEAQELRARRELDRLRQDEEEEKRKESSRSGGPRAGSERSTRTRLNWRESGWSMSKPRGKPGVSASEPRSSGAAS